MKKVCFRKDLNCLRPTDEAASQALAKLKHGVEIMVEWRRPRSIQQHKLYWALINLVWSNQEHIESPDRLHTLIKYRLGHTETMKTKRGIIEYPKSTNFESMPQDDFNDYFNRAVDFICQEVIPGLDRDALKVEIYEMIGIPTSEVA